MKRAYEARKEERSPKERSDVAEPETEWLSFKTAIISATTKTCGHSKKRLPLWQSPELLNEINFKRTSYKKMLDAKTKLSIFLASEPPLDATHKAALELEAETTELIYKAARKMCSKASYKAKGEFWAQAATELENSFSNNEIADAYQHLRSYLRKPTKRTTDLVDKKGNILTSVEDKLKRWAEHYEDLLTTNHSVDERTLRSLFQDSHENPPPEPEPPPPNADDIRQAIGRLKSRRAPGICQITPEMIKHGGEATVLWLHDIIQSVWTHEKTPQDWRDAIIIPLFKKGDTRNCDNYRGLSLLSVPGKVYAHILLKQVAEKMNQMVLDEQSGFRPAHSTIDHLFSLNQLFSNAIEFRQPLHVCFIDLRKAYDTVNRPALWAVLQKTGLSTKIIRLIKELHTGTTSKVRTSGAYSRSFSTNKGVRQGCVMSPALFNIFLDTVVRQALFDMKEGVSIKYTCGDEVYSLKLTEELTTLDLVQILLYADDMSIVCSSAKGLERLVQRLDEITQKWLLDISQKKTKLMTVDYDGKEDLPVVNLRGETIKAVDHFKYLGRIFENTHDIDKEISNRINKATRSFTVLKPPLFCRKEVSTRTKIRIFNSVCIPALLYGTETWAIKESQLARLERFQNRCLRVILKIFFATHGQISNSAIRQKALNQPSVEQLIRTHRLRWFGRAYHMHTFRLPNKMLSAQPPHGKRPQGKRFLTWRELLRSDLEQLFIEETWHDLVSNHKTWKSINFDPQKAKSPWQGRLRHRKGGHAQ